MKPKKLFKVLKKIMLGALCLILNINLLAQNPRQISGTVTASDGSTLTGVTVAEKGTTSNGTITGADGKYSITVESGATLVFSFVGMISQEVATAGQTTINVIMIEDVVGLEEVIVVGYGTTRKVDLTSSVSAAQGESFTKASTPSLAQNLAGKLTGVVTTQLNGTPGFENSELVIRGQGSLSNYSGAGYNSGTEFKNGSLQSDFQGAKSALVLVDGIEREWSRIDPNDIASISVLKDASAAAVFGARAANGVVLITTKRGISGKTKISYTGTYGIQGPTIREKHMDSWDYAKYFDIATRNAINGTTYEQSLALRAAYIPKYSETDLENYRNGTLPNTNWWDKTFSNTPIIETHNISATGGNDKTTFYLSLGYLNQKGYYENSHFKRYNLRTNVDTKVTDNFSVGMDVAFHIEDKNRSSTPDDLIGQRINTANPTLPFDVPKSVDPNGIAYDGYSRSPYGEANRAGYDNVGQNRIETSLTAKFIIPGIKGLYLKGRYSLDKTLATEKYFKTPINTYVYDFTNDIWTSYPDNAVITYEVQKRDFQQATSQLSLNYENTFGNHNISGLILGEAGETKQYNVTASRDGYMSTALPYLFAGYADQINNNDFALETARLSLVGRIDYNYASKYYLQANFRYDGSQNFAKGSRFGFFPSVSGAWRVSQESFMANIPFISELKIRGSYGLLGNDRISPYQYLNGFNFSNGYVLGNQAYQPNIQEKTIPNTAVSWETAHVTDIGLDLSLLDGKIQLESDYFLKNTTGILLPETGSIPGSFGVSSNNLPNKNIGASRNEGIELLLRYKNVAGDFSYSIEGTMTYVKNTVVAMPEGANTPDYQSKIGRQIGEIYTYLTDGLFQSLDEIANAPDQKALSGGAIIEPGDIKYVDVNGDKVVDAKDQRYIGKNLIPKFVFGLNLNASYKGFAIAANFQGATGFIREYSLNGPYGLNANPLEALKDSWSADNTDARYPRMVANGATNNRVDSDFWLEKGDYVRLKNLEISYIISKISLFKTLGVESIRLFAAGTNVLTFASNKLDDPEMYNSRDHLGYPPPMKSYMFGVNLNF